jgi:hypothetical protein
MDKIFEAYKQSINEAKFSAGDRVTIKKIRDPEGKEFSGKTGKIEVRNSDGTYLIRFAKSDRSPKNRYKGNAAEFKAGEFVMAESSDTINEGGVATHKIHLKVLEGPFKGNKKKFTYIRTPETPKDYKVGDVMEINVRNTKNGPYDKCEITKITKLKD